MSSSVRSVDYTIPGGPNWFELGEPTPLSIKHGDCVCAIEQAKPTVLILAKGHISENTGRFVKNDVAVQLPFTGQFCRFMELGDTLCVFVMADDMQTCAIFDWNTGQTYADSQIPIPLPANAMLVRVLVIDETTMQMTYTLNRVSTTIDIALAQD